MRNAVNNKTLLLVFGLLVGLATLFSHSLRVEIKNSKPKTEQTQDPNEQKVVITPSDAVTVNAFSFHVDSFFEIAPVFRSIENITKAAPAVQKTASTYFQTLFRFIISPNAP